MSYSEKELQPMLSHAEPVLAVRDVPETIQYWQEVLGFPTQWTWGEPPTLGAVSWHGVFVQFSQNPALAAASNGNSIWIRVQRVEALYNFHQKKNAEIVAPLENQPWGMAQYSLREINGYFLHFAGAPLAEREKSTATLPPTVRISGRIPTAKEYRHLHSAVGWSSINDALAETRLAAAVFAAVAEDTVSGEVVGCGLLLGDHASFYYVKDVMVHPDWQGKRIGTALMQELTHWLERNAAENTLVGLFTGENLAPFYQQFGFSQAFGMVRHIQRNKKGK